MTQLNYGVPAQNAPAPPQAPAQPVPPPPGDVSGSMGDLQAYEAQFLGGLLGTLVDTAGPIALKWLRDRVNSMGAAAADDTAVAQEVDRFQAQFFGAIAPFLPIAIDVIGKLIRGATSGQAAGAGGTSQGAGAAAADQGSGVPISTAYVR